MNYYYTKNGIIIDENRNKIPMEEGNSIYQAYLEFLSNNGVVEPTDLLSDYEIELENKVQVPQVASKMRFFLALFNIGIIRQMIYDAINQIPDTNLKEIISIKFDLSQDFERNDEHLNIMANMFNISQQQLDELFIEANKI